MNNWHRWLSSPASSIVTRKADKHQRAALRIAFRAGEAQAATEIAELVVKKIQINNVQGGWTCSPVNLRDSITDAISKRYGVGSE